MASATETPERPFVAHRNSEGVDSSKFLGSSNVIHVPNLTEGLLLDLFLITPILGSLNSRAHKSLPPATDDKTALSRQSKDTLQ